MNIYKKFLVLFVLMVGMFGITNVVNANYPSVEFTAGQYYELPITLGQSATLTWSSTGASVCTSIGPGSNYWSTNGATSGTAVVTPGATQTYSIKCNAYYVGDGWVTTRTVKVVVLPVGNTFIFNDWGSNAPNYHITENPLPGYSSPFYYTAFSGNFVVPQGNDFNTINLTYDLMAVNIGQEMYFQVFIDGVKVLDKFYTYSAEDFYSSDDFPDNFYFISFVESIPSLSFSPGTTHSLVIKYATHTMSGCTIGCFNMPNSLQMRDFRINALRVYDAICSPIHYNCALGTDTNHVINPDSWTWDCLPPGTNGGATASCIEDRYISLSASPTALSVVSGGVSKTSDITAVFNVDPGLSYTPSDNSEFPFNLDVQLDCVGTCTDTYRKLIVGPGNAKPSATSYTVTVIANKGTASGSIEVPVTVSPAIPTCTTPTATNITSSTAKLGGNITNDGGATITSRGTAWGTSANPTGNKLATGGTTGVFTQDRSGFSPNTTYHYRAYATNSAGTGYCPDATFTTSSANFPDLTAGAVSPTTATVNVPQTFSATITNVGNAPTTSSFPFIFQKATDANGAGAVDLTPAGTVSVSLSSGQSSVVSKSITFTSTGTFYLRVCADKSSASGGGNQTESDENNNCGQWTAITVTSLPTCSLYSSPNTVDYNESTTLSWSSSGASSISDISWTNAGGSGTIDIYNAPVSGYTSSGNLTSPTTFSLTATGTGGSTTCTTIVNVNPPDPLIQSFDANPTLINGGDFSALTWSSIYATSCTSPDFETGGQTTSEIPVNVTPNGSPNPKNYTLTCTGATGTTPDSASVTVTIKPSVTLTASPNPTDSGGPVTLAWNSTYATSCSATWTESTTTSGTKQVYPTTATTYSITCYGMTGTLPAQDSVIVNINPTASLTATPPTITKGNSSLLTWTSQNASSCTGTGFNTGSAIFNDGTANPVWVSPIATTTYTIDCVGLGTALNTHTIDSATVTIGTGMSGWLTTNSPCVIALGQSTCNILFSWDTINPEATSCITSPSFPLGMGASFCVNSGTNVSHSVPFGLSNYYLYNNAKLLDQAGVGASCGDNSWDGTKCVALPTVALHATSTLISYGESTGLYWESTNATTCNAVADPINNQWTGAQPLNKLVSNPKTITNLQKTTIFTLTCTNSSSGLSASSSVTVGVGSAPPMTGTLLPASQTCEIPSGASSCGNTLTWTTTNPQGTSAVTSKYGTPSPVNGNNGSQLFTVHNIGDTWFFLYNNGVELAQSVITASCVTGNHWDGTKCVVDLGYPTVDIVATPPSVDSGGESFLTWTSTNVDTCIASGDWSGSKPVNKLPPGVGTGPLTVSKTYTLTCTNILGGSVMDSVTVTVNSNEMSGTLTVEPNCEIGAGESTCLVDVDWKVTNPENPGGSQVTSNWPINGTVVGSEDTGHVTADVPYSFRRFFLYNNGVLLDQGIANASCVANYYYDGTKCVYFSPTVTLTADDKSVVSGGTTTLTWSSTYANLGCSASSDPSTISWSGSKLTSGNQPTDPLTETTTYTLTCNGDGGQASGSATVRVTTTDSGIQPVIIEN